MKTSYKKDIIRISAILLILMMFSMTSCRKKAKPENSEVTPNSSETENSTEVNDSTDENKEEEYEPAILENEGELEIILSEDEDSFGE